MIIADTGFWVALIDEKDSYHQMAKQALKLSVDQRDFNAYRWKNTQPFQNLLL